MAIGEIGYRVGVECIRKAEPLAPLVVIACAQCALSSFHLAHFSSFIVMRYHWGSKPQCVMSAAEMPSAFSSFGALLNHHNGNSSVLCPAGRKVIVPYWFDLTTGKPIHAL